MSLAEDFLQNLQMSKLTVDQLASLNDPISSEVSGIIKQLPKNKAPGPDGLTTDFYKILHDDVLPTLSQVYGNMCKGGPYLP